MLFFGLFYLLSPLMIPAYIQAQNTPVLEYSVGYNNLFLSVLTMTFFIVLGILLDKHKRARSKKKGGKKWTHIQD